MEKATFDNLSIGDTVKVLAGKYKNKVGTVKDMDENFNQVDVLVKVDLATSDMRYLGFEDIEIINKDVALEIKRQIGLERAGQ